MKLVQKPFCNALDPHPHKSREGMRGWNVAPLSIDVDGKNREGQRQYDS
jgi:hypothetical protein